MFIKMSRNLKKKKKKKTRLVRRLWFERFLLTIKCRKLSCEHFSCTFYGICFAEYFVLQNHCTSSSHPNLWFGYTEMRRLTILTALLVRTYETIQTS